MKQIKFIISVFLSIVLFGQVVFAQEQASSTKPGNGTKVFQSTFIPPLGTSGTSAHRYSNKFSFNILGGYNGGVEYLELGGIANINNGDVFGGQISGFTNINIGKTQGIQVAGFYNQVSKNMDGLQAAGFMNLNMQNTSGLSLSGFTNVSSANMAGGQFAGFANITKGTVTGLQLAGFINVAKKVNGVQLAFINVADSISGIPIGFISVVKNGYHKFEISANESLLGNIRVKTGIKHFYNIFTVGAKSTGNAFFWGLGYGLGGGVALTKKVGLNFDVIGQHINENQWTNELNIMGTFKINVSFKITKGFEFFAGPSYNVFAAELSSSENIMSNFVPWDFYNETFYYDDVNVKMYLGFNAGLRF